MRPLALGVLAVVELRKSDSLIAAVSELTRLSPRVVLNRAKRLHGRRLVRNAFVDRWPARVDELRAEPAHELLREPALVAEIARLLRLDMAVVSKHLEMAPSLSAGAALLPIVADLAPISRNDALHLIVSQARSRNVVGIADLLNLDEAVLRRRLRRAHGAMLVKNALADLLPAVATPVRGWDLHFGRFALTGAQWSGGFGDVREALDQSASPPRRVVLKWARRTDANAVLEGEYERARDLRHPGLVGYFQCQHEPDGTPVLVIEHGGTSLKSILADRKFSVRDALGLCRKLALALDYLARRKLAHRDLHPGNILLGDHDEPRITDFGIARRLRGVGGSTTVTSPVVGHYPDFAAPEVKRGTASQSSDQYSLALVFLSCVCGMDEALDCIDRDEFPPSLSQEQVEVFRVARSESPARRFASCTAFVDKLAAAQGPGWLTRIFGSRAPQDPPTSGPRPKPSRR